MKASHAIDDGTLVASSMLEAAKLLGLTQPVVAKTIGVSSPTLSRIKANGAISSDSKSFELAILLIRLYRALYAIVDGNEAAMKHWMKTSNKHLNGEAPKDLIQSIPGLMQTLAYLDASRGKL